MTLDGVRDVVPVGIGDVHVSDQPGDVLVAYGLGSCVGVVVHDPVMKAGGMAHVALPKSLSARESGTFSDFRYADTGVSVLLDGVLRLGADRVRLVARIAGGARMFDVLPELEFMDIGARNAEAVRGVLSAMRIPIVAEDIGGTDGRTMRYVVGRGKVFVRRLGMSEEEL